MLHISPALVAQECLQSDQCSERDRFVLQKLLRLGKVAESIERKDLASAYFSLIKKLHDTASDSKMRRTVWSKLGEVPETRQMGFYKSCLLLGVFTQELTEREVL